MATILQFVPRASAFDADALSVMGDAFDAACAERPGISDTAREIIARRIIEAAKRGERDFARLRKAGTVSLDVGDR